jgi:hypothetical protein
LGAAQGHVDDVKERILVRRCMRAEHAVRGLIDEIEVEFEIGTVAGRIHTDLNWHASAVLHSLDGRTARGIARSGSSWYTSAEFRR